MCAASPFLQVGGGWGRKEKATDFFLYRNHGLLWPSELEQQAARWGRVGGRSRPQGAGSLQLVFIVQMGPCWHASACHKRAQVQKTQKVKFPYDSATEVFTRCLSR